MNPMTATNNELALGQISPNALLRTVTFGTGRQENQGKLILEPNKTGDKFTIIFRRTRNITRTLRGQVSKATALMLMEAHDLGAEYQNIDHAEAEVRKLIRNRRSSNA